MSEEEISVETDVSGAETSVSVEETDVSGAETEAFKFAGITFITT